MLLPYPFAGPFDYRVPPDLHPRPGDIVLVPLNRREEVGVVWDAPADEAVPAHKLKSVVGILDTPPMRESLRRFIDWIAAYTLSPPGDVMAMALRVVTNAFIRPVDALPARRSVARGADHSTSAAGAGCAGARGTSAGRRSVPCGRGQRGGAAGHDRGRSDHRDDRAAGRAVSAPRPGLPGTGAVGSAARGRRGVAQGGRRSRFFGDVAGRRHRLRQDRGVSGGRRGLSARKGARPW